MPFAVFGQSQNIRHVITPDGEVTFWRGQQQLTVRGYTGEPIYVADHYVAVNGDDANPGTFEQPWATWSKAFDEVAAGDTVYIRGGEYYTTVAFEIEADNIDGTAENLICIFNYPGEKPILNLINITVNPEAPNYNRGTSICNCEYWHIKGLEIKNVNNLGVGGNTTAFYFENCSNIISENCVAHDIEGIGFESLTQPGLMTYINCDAYDNYDPLSAIPGGNADGFQCMTGETWSNSVTIYTGCRSWNNSDDGYDCLGFEGIVTYDSCWAFSNGWQDEGDGDGFKLGATYEIPKEEPQRILRNCIAYGNKNIGFDENQEPGNYVLDADIFNNVAYDNYSGFVFQETDTKTVILRNNIAYNNENDIYLEGCTDDHNSWDADPPVTVTNADFVSVDGGQLDNSRQSDGSLPVITFFHLVTGSDLKNAGVDVGLPYMGAAPDIGCFEFDE